MERITFFELKKLKSTLVQKSIDLFTDLKPVLEKWTGLRLPELPNDTQYSGDWGRLFNIWFFEKSPRIAGASWDTSGDIETLKFTSRSVYTKDLKDKSVGMRNAVKKFKKDHDFESLSIGQAIGNNNDYNFSFTGPGSGTGDYGMLEWYLGSYRVRGRVTAKNDEKGIVTVEWTVTNSSTWHSATRLPETYQNEVVDIINKLLFWRDTDITEFTNLVDTRPRGEVGRQIMEKYIEELNAETPAWMNVPAIPESVKIPSFGGTFNQEFKWEQKIQFPVMTLKLKKVSYGGENVGNDLSMSLSVTIGSESLTFNRNMTLKAGTSRNTNFKLYNKVPNDLSSLISGNGNISISVFGTLTERDPKYDDSGSISGSFNTNIFGPATSTNSISGSITGDSIGDESRAATIDLEFETDIKPLAESDN